MSSWVKSHPKVLDLAVLMAWAVFSYGLVLAIDANYVTLIAITFDVPILYLLLRNRREAPKVIIASLLLLPLAITINYFAYISGTWINQRSIFESLAFGTFLWEDFLWGLSFFLYVIAFYEHFLDVGQKSTVSTTRLARRAFVWSLILCAALIAFVIVVGGTFSVPYYYLIVGTALITLPVIVLIKYPNLLQKLLEVNTFFFFIFLLHELAALQLGIWDFPANNFVGTVTVLGHAFPLEEFVFFICLSAPTIVAFYEFFDDDRK